MPTMMVLVTVATSVMTGVVIVIIMMMVVIRWPIVRRVFVRALRVQDSDLKDGAALHGSPGELPPGDQLRRSMVGALPGAIRWSMISRRELARPCTSWLK